MFKFYVIYTIDIPIDDENLYMEYDELDTEELIQLAIKKDIEIEIPTFNDIEDTEEGADDRDYYDSHMNEFYEDYGVNREELMLLIIADKDPSYYEKLLKENCAEFICDNELFRVTEEENESDEYYYAFSQNVLHRKYVGTLEKEDFVKFIDIIYPDSTSNMMGIICEYGNVGAFALEINTHIYGIYENAYVSILFNDDHSQEVMIEIEDEVRKLIDNDCITIDKLEEIIEKYEYRD